MSIDFFRTFESEMVNDVISFCGRESKVEDGWPDSQAKEKFAWVESAYRTET